MHSQEERNYFKQKQQEAKERMATLAELDEIAEALKLNKNPNAGRITVKSADGVIKHVYQPKTLQGASV